MSSSIFPCGTSVGITGICPLHGQPWACEIAIKKDEVVAKSAKPELGFKTEIEGEFSEEPVPVVESTDRKGKRSKY